MRRGEGDKKHSARAVVAGVSGCCLEHAGVVGPPFSVDECRAHARGQDTMASFRWQCFAGNCAYVPPPPYPGARILIFYV